MFDLAEASPLPAPTPLRLAVLVGTRGRGSNMMAVHAASQDGRLAAHIALVVGSKADAPALIRAQEAGLQTVVVDPKPGDYAEQLLACCTGASVTAIALAGFLRRLPAPIVSAYRHRIVNIHPALLPAFGGKGMYGHHVHEAVLAYGAKVSGCTAHLVDEDYDTGPVLVQKVVPVEEGDTPDTLAARILPREHEAFVEALQLLAAGRVTVRGRIAHLTPHSSVVR